MTSAINLAHIVVIVPILYYIYKNQKELKEKDCKYILYNGIIGFVYHLYKYKEVMDGKEEKWKDWIFLLHILFIFPLLIYIGYNCEKTKRKYFELLLVGMFAALGYHTYNFFKYLKK